MSDEYDDYDGDTYTADDLATAARMAALETREAGLRTLLAFAAAHDLPAASVLKALGGSSAGVVEVKPEPAAVPVVKAAPSDPPVDDDADDDDTDVYAPSPDDVIEAAMQIAEEAAAAGEDASDVLELLASRLKVEKAFDESKHKRDHGKFSSTGGASGEKTKTGKESKPKKPTKTELKLQKRAEAKTAASAHLKARASGKTLNASEAADLIGHLAHLTHADLRELRKEHGASFGGERRKGNRTASLVKWAKNEIGKKRRAQQGSALQQVVDYGGIDPNSHDFKRFYGSIKDAVNDGIPLAAFKRGGNGLDEIAAQMASAGHISLPDWEDPSEHVMGLLRGRKMLNWGDADKRHADAYAEHVAGQLEGDDGGAKFDPNANLWDDELDADWFRKSHELHADATPAERLAAAVEVALAALEDGTDPAEALDRISEHAEGETFEKAWDESKHPRSDKGQFVSKDAIQAAKSDPAKAKELKKRVTDPEQRKKLDAALADPEVIGTKRGLAKHEAETKRAEKVANRAKAREIRIRLIDQDSRGEELNPDDLRALIPHLGQMSHEELSHTRELLARQGASFGGKRLRADRVAALVAWATGKAEAKPEPAAAESGSGAGEDDLPLDLAEMGKPVSVTFLTNSAPPPDPGIWERHEHWETGGAEAASKYAPISGTIHKFARDAVAEARGIPGGIVEGINRKGKPVTYRAVRPLQPKDMPATQEGREEAARPLRERLNELVDKLDLRGGAPNRDEAFRHINNARSGLLYLESGRDALGKEEITPSAYGAIARSVAQSVAQLSEMAGHPPTSVVAGRGDAPAPQPTGTSAAPVKTRLQALAERAHAAGTPTDDVNTEYAKPRDQYAAFVRAVVPPDGTKPDSAKVLDYLGTLPDHARERLDQHFRAGGKSLREIEQYHRQAAGQVSPEQVRAERQARADAGDAARGAMSGSGAAPSSATAEDANDKRVERNVSKWADRSSLHPGTRAMLDRPASELSEDEARKQLAELSASRSQRAPGAEFVQPGSPTSKRIADRVNELRERLRQQPWQRTQRAVQGATGLPPHKHKETVSDALAAGKSVPAEVLADYPDLAAKHGQGGSGAAPKDPAKDADHLNALAARESDPAVKDAIESAAHNLHGVTGDATAKRRATVEQLAASHRILHDGGNAAGAGKVAQVIAGMGGKLHGPAVGETVEGNGRYYDMPAGSFTGDKLTVKRQPVVHTDAQGREFVAGRGELATGSSAATPSGGGGEPPKPEKQPWEMTAEEYAAKHAGEFDTRSASMDAGKAKRHHAQIVMNRVLDGDAVPPERIKEYPHLDMEAMQSLAKRTAEANQQARENRAKTREAGRDAKEKRLAEINYHANERAEHDANASQQTLREYMSGRFSPSTVEKILSARLSASGRRVDDSTGSSLGVTGGEQYRRHYQAVKNTLAAGKTVPPEVLADYPDLAAKYGG